MKRLTVWWASTALVLVIMLVVGRFSVLRGQTGGSGFHHDEDNAILVVDSAFYEVAFRDTDGKIVYIADKATGQHISDGSLSCLWGVVFDYSPPAEYIEACDYQPAGANEFSFNWEETTRELTLRYRPAPTATKSISATVTMLASTDNWFDLQFVLENDWAIPEDVKFPSDLTFARESLEEALLPVLPGVILESGYFSRGLTYEGTYPGNFFADFVAVQSTTGQLAMYSIQEGDRVTPAFYGFAFPNCGNTSTVCLTHNLKSGAGVSQNWISPRLRFRVGESHFDSIQAFRSDNSFEGFLAVEEKLGLLYQQLIQLPLYKADIGGIKFADLPPLLAEVPYPGLLHLVAYWEGGFDENYPDFLPPEDMLGTQEELVAMMQQARSKGYLIMPYTNPTWWDDESSTVQNDLPPLIIEDIAVIKSDGSPRFENYGDHGGFVVSPYHNFVRQRLDQLMLDMTQGIGSDLIYEDQVGGRSWVADYNVASPDSAAFSQGWLEHTRQYSDNLLTSEMGFDRLAETETGFHGSALLDEAVGKTVDWWGIGNWRYYPFAPILIRDKVLLYHNTEHRAATDEKRVLAMNLGFGYMLGYDWTAPEAQPEWLAVVGAYQKYVLAHFANERISAYDHLTADVTQTIFETVTSVVNWSNLESYSIGDFELPPQGVLVSSNGGGFTAGIFTQYNGQLLSEGDHYLIEERKADQIVIRQPLGAATELTIRTLPQWDESTRLIVWAYDGQGKAIVGVPFSISPGNITFAYESSLGEQDVVYHTIEQAASLNLQEEAQGRVDHSGAEIAAWQGGRVVASELTDVQGKARLDLPTGVYTLTIELDRYLDASRANVVVSRGLTTTLSKLELLGGDANDDDVINILDLSLMGGRFGISCGAPGWDNRADINNDCTVNILDLSVSGGNYNETSPVLWP